MRSALVAPDAVSRAVVSLEQAVVLTDRSGTILWTNDGVRNLFGSDPATCIGDRIERWIPGLAAKGAWHLDPREGNVVGAQGRRVEAFRDDGSPITVLLTVQVDEQGPDPLFVATMTDLGRHDKQTALSARVAHLEADRAAREEVLAFVTHEVRNALAPVRIAVDNLLADVPGSGQQLSFAPDAPAPPEGPPCGQDAHPRPGPSLSAASSGVFARPAAPTTVEADASTLRLLGHSTDAALEILNGILDIERLRRGKSLLADWFSLHEMLEHVYQAATLVGGEAGVSVCEDRSEDVRALEVFAAESKLAQCLTNFVTNAVKFTPYGGTVTIYACVEEPTPASALRPAASMSGGQRPAGRLPEPEGANAPRPEPPIATASPIAAAADAAAGAEVQRDSSHTSAKMASCAVPGPPSYYSESESAPELALCTLTARTGSAAAPVRAGEPISTGCTDSGLPGRLSLEITCCRKVPEGAGRSSTTGTTLNRDLQSSKGIGDPSSLQRTPPNRVSSLMREETVATTPTAQSVPAAAKELVEGGAWRSRDPYDGPSDIGPPSSASTTATIRKCTTSSLQSSQRPVPQLSEPVDADDGEGDGQFSAFSKGPEQGLPETPMAWRGADVEQQQWLRLGVRDTGAGVPPEQRSRLFTVFEQLPNRKTRQGVGTGLGLAFVREVVERGHGGRVGLESEGAGKGADFFFLIPLEQTRDGDGDTRARGGADAGHAASLHRGASGRRSSPTPALSPPQDTGGGECLAAPEGAGEGAKNESAGAPPAPSTPPFSHGGAGAAPGQPVPARRPPTLSMAGASSLRRDQAPGRGPGLEPPSHAQTPQPAGTDVPGIYRLIMEDQTQERRPLGPIRPRKGPLSARLAAVGSPLEEDSPTQSGGAPSALGPASDASRSTRASRRSGELPFLPKVLVVDDSGIVVKLLARRLSAWGAVARKASSGEEALQQLEEAEAGGTPFHCLLTDLNMPDAEVQGDELARRAAMRWPTLAIIITSGDDQATAPGAHARLVKPVSAIKLFSTIRRHVGRMHRMSELTIIASCACSLCRLPGNSTRR